MSRTRIKICGVRDLDTALHAIDAGADALGFVFAKASPRYIDPRLAFQIMGAMPPMATTIGLFVDASIEQYMKIERLCPTDYAQLHGRESEHVVSACGPRVIKAVRFDPETIAHELERWSNIPEVDAILVDGSTGGQGVAFDWTALAAARDAAQGVPIFLAGGLTPENVGEAIAAAHPYAVDVSSGVEIPGEPGVKDPDRVEAFCAAVREADARV
ncbi:MAG: phosphoribosylanthranilate isomerase [Phycisphaerales bacterium]|nr:MAG: phosphoribosylanthranilate isomerase [Phycisphaerales bacterium]